MSTTIEILFCRSQLSEVLRGIAFRMLFPEVSPQPKWIGSILDPTTSGAVVLCVYTTKRSRSYPVPVCYPIFFCIASIEDPV